MTKTNLEILDFEDKETQKGKPYSRFKTSDGWMSCFDSKTIPQLKQKINQGPVTVDLVESGEFKNIKKFLGDEDAVEVEKVGKVAENGLKAVKNEFPDSMRVAYAKDVFIAMLGRISQGDFENWEEKERLELMDQAVKAIKKAESEFKFA